MLYYCSSSLHSSPPSPQTDVVNDDDDDNDTTAVADSAWTDSLIHRNDTLAWPKNVQAEIEQLLKSEMFQTSQVGIMIYDLDADSAIFRHNERQLMRPASTMKTITAITALDRLGGGYQFKTEALLHGACRLHDSQR